VGAYVLRRLAGACRSTPTLDLTMRLAVFVAVCVSSVSACSEQEVVTVRVRASGYDIPGVVASPLATPIVDEIVRRHADVVYLDACRPRDDDPARKYYGDRLAQIRLELAPRFRGKITGNLDFMEKVCAE
jgi:hypothetical protein